MKILTFGNYKIKLLSILFFLFVLFYIISLIYLSFVINVSEDEMYTINTSSHSIGKVIHQSYNFEGQPPAYFVILSLWRQMNSGIFFARLLSVLFIILSIWYFNKLVSLISGNEYSDWIVILYMLNPFTVWAALEIRLYAFLICLSAAALYYYLEYFNSNRKKHLYLFLFISIIGLYTQYFFAFLISSLAFSFFLFKGPRPFIKLVPYLILVLALFLPNLFFMSEQFAIHTYSNVLDSLLNRFLLIIFSIKEIVFADGQILVNFWIVRIIKIIYILLIGNAVYLLYKKQRILKDAYFEKFNIVLFSLFLIILQYIAFILISPIVFVYKYLAIVFPLLIMIFSLGKQLPSYKKILFFGTMPIYFILLLLLLYQHPVKSYDYKSIASYIKNIEYKNEPILIYRAALSLSFEQYYNGINMLVPLPQKVRYDTTYLINIKSTKELEQSINRIKTNPKTYLLITDLSEYEYCLDMNREMVDDYFHSKYKITLDTLFVGWSKYGPLRIRRLERFK